MAGVVLEHSALATGFLAAAIAVGGFIARAGALLQVGFEPDLQWAATLGGLCGLSFGLIIVIIDAIVG